MSFSHRDVTVYKAPSMPEDSQSNFVSSRDLQKARRMAQRSRILPACANCEAAKAKCSKARPCRRCVRNGDEASCMAQELSPEPEVSVHPRHFK